VARCTGSVRPAMLGERAGWFAICSGCSIRSRGVINVASGATSTSARAAASAGGRDRWAIYTGAGILEYLEDPTPGLAERGYSTIRTSLAEQAAAATQAVSAKLRRLTFEELRRVDAALRLALEL